MYFGYPFENVFLRFFELNYDRLYKKIVLKLFVFTFQTFLNPKIQIEKNCEIISEFTIRIAVK